MEIIKNIPEFEENTNYWIVRSGVENTFYDEFFFNSCIALGWDRINDIESIKKMKDVDQLKSLVREKYKELESLKESNKKGAYNRKISDISMKIFRFSKELKVGDIIVTPGNDEVLIGKITSEAYETNIFPKVSNDNQLIGSLNKARKVKWIKRIKRVDLEPNFRLILGVYHGIAHINSEQVITEINRTLYSSYKRGDKGHSIFRITEEAEIDFEKYAYFINTTREIYKILKENFEKDKLIIKTNVQSPGPIEFIGEFRLVNSIVLGVKAFLKNDTEALNEMDYYSKIKIKKYIENNTPEYDYDDYEFPNYGNY